MESNGSLSTHATQNLPFVRHHLPVPNPHHHPTNSTFHSSPARTPSCTAQHPSTWYCIAMMISFFKIAAFLFLSHPLLISSALSADVLYCDRRAEYDVKVHGVEISPYPVIKGQPATFSISATSGQPISGGKLVIDVSYFGVHIHSEVHDLCAETSCPISAGDFLIEHSQVLPGFTPPGSYTLKMKMEDASKHQLTCIGFDFSIGSALPVADS